MLYDVGLRSNHSQIYPFIHLLKPLSRKKRKSNPEFTMAFLYDLSKAFDKSQNSSTALYNVYRILYSRHSIWMGWKVFM